MIYKGSCLCGKVTFEVSGEFESFFFCHCERCRKDTGSAHAANLFSTTAVLNWLCDISIKPTGHIYMSHKANWDENLEEVSRFDELPPQI